MKGSDLVYIDSEGVHCWITHFVVGSVDENFVKYLIEARDKAHGLRHHRFAVMDPERLLLVLDAADVCVWAEQNML